MVDRYTKTVLTVIGVCLVWMALQQSIPSASAVSSAPTAVFLAQISDDVAKCMHVTFLKGDTGPCIGGR